MKGLHSWRGWLRLTLFALRDGLIPFLPQSINRKLLAPADFAFLVHPRDLRDVERRYPAFRRLPTRLQNCRPRCLDGIDHQLRHLALGADAA